LHRDDHADMAARIMMASEMQGWLSHAFGTINFFLAAGPKARRDKYTDALFNSTYAQAVSVLRFANFVYIANALTPVAAEHTHRLGLSL